VTTNAVHGCCGMRPAGRAISARSDQVKRARPTWRPKTATWWRNTKISASFANVSVLANPRGPKARWTRRKRSRAALRAASPTPSWLVKTVAGSFWTLQGEAVAVEERVERAAAVAVAVAVLAENAARSEQGQHLAGCCPRGRGCRVAADHVAGCGGSAGSRSTKRSPWRRAQVVSDPIGSAHSRATWVSGGAATAGTVVARRRRPGAVTGVCVSGRRAAFGRRFVPAARRSPRWGSCPRRRGAARTQGCDGRRAPGWVAAGRAGPW